MFSTYYDKMPTFSPFVFFTTRKKSDEKICLTGKIYQRSGLAEEKTIPIHGKNRKNFEKRD